MRSPPRRATLPAHGILLLVICHSLTASALELPTLVAPRPTPLDSLRHEAILARCAGDWDRMNDLHRTILQRNPGDGWTIAEIGSALDNRNQIQSAVEAMLAGDWDVTPAVRMLTPAGREFLLGICHYNMQRYQQARDRLATALAGDESLQVAHYYLAYTNRNLLRPRTEIEAHLQTLLSDPDHAFWALRFICDSLNADLYGELYGEALRLAEAYRTLPGCAASIDRITVSKRLRAGNLTPVICEEIWTQYRQAHGALVADLADMFGFYLYRYLDVDDMLDFFTRHADEVNQPPVWFEYQATALLDQGYHARVDKLLADADALSSDGLHLRLETARKLRGAAETLAISRLLVARSYSPRSIGSVMTLWRELGLESEVADLRRHVQRENPVIVLSQRLSRLVKDDIRGARSVLDSLARLEVSHPRLDYARYQVAEDSGERPSPGELARNPIAIEMVFECMARASQAFATGQPERGEDLLDLIVSRLANSPDTMGRVGYLAYVNNREEFTERVLTILDAHCANSPLAIELRFTSLMHFQRYREAKDLLVQAAGKQDLDPILAANLARGAAALDEDQLADAFLALATEAAPVSATVRAARATILSGRGASGAAIAILQPLVLEYPGVEFYRSQLIAIGGAVDNLADYSGQDMRDRFASFDHDLATVDWMLERMVDPDSVQDAEAIYLREQTSYNLRNRDTYDERNRFTLQILSEAGVDYHQTMRVAFHPAQGLPQIVVARVVAPDGTITEVPRADILIGAPDDEEVDVSDTRHLVIPFPGLDVGDIIDLVYDRSHESFLGRGWSFRHVFGDDLQIREELVEIQIPAGLAVQIYQEHGPPPTARETPPDSTFHRWRLTDLDPLEVADMGPSAFVQIPWIGCTSHASWAEIGRTYGEHFWPQTEVMPAIANLARKLTAGRDDDHGRLEAVFEYVENDIQSLAIELDRGRLVPTPAAEVLARSYGDCKDKVSLMIALLAAIDIRCFPVLVSVRPGFDVFPDFVEAGCFSHVVAYLPDLAGGVFSDPTLGTQCARDLPASICGGYGLVIDRESVAGLQPIPELQPDQSGFDLQADIRPLPGDRAEITLNAVFRGEAASELSDFFTLADTAMTGMLVDYLMGDPIWASCQRLTWQHAKPDCSALTLQVTYRDTAWAGDDINMVPFQFASLVATHLELPDPEDREQDVCLDYPFVNRATLRIHDAEGWRIDQRVAPLQVKGTHHAGAIRCREVRGDDKRYLQIDQEFRADRRVIPAREYPAFWDDWYRFRVGVSQVYRYYHILDSQRIADLEDYAARHPDDAAFALQAVDQILGSDLGGDGETGYERRAIARRILDRTLQSEHAGAMHYLMLAAIHSKDRRYRAADSLATRAVQLEKNNPVALMSALNYKQELNDREGEVAILRQLSLSGGAAWVEAALAGALYALARDEEASAVEARLRLLYADADTTILVLARVNGYSRSGRHDRARAALQTVEGLIPEEEYKLFLSDIMIEEEDYRSAIAVLEDVWAKQPLDAFVCNNLAWCLALTGRDLERAEELVEASIILAEDPTASQNTLGAVYARQGRWQEARDIFAVLFAEDDRPQNHIVNGYFIGLCDYQLERREEALLMWHQLLAVENVPLWHGIVQASLDLAARGEDVSTAIFVKND